MPRSALHLTPVLTLLLGAAALIGACSSSSDDSTLDSAGGTAATGGSSGSAAKGGTGGASGSATGGSSNASSGGSSNASSGGSATGGSGNASSGGSSNAGSGGSGAYPTDACFGIVADPSGEAGNGTQSCTGISAEAEPVPIDLFIMMDRSVSMANLVPGTSMTRWEAITEAVREFTEESSGEDIRAGIGFFGRTGGNDDQLDCSQDYYAKPKVAIGELGTTGPDIVDAMVNMVPGGLTPAAPALAGALEYATEWAKDNVGRATAVVLVSDGYPTQCQPQSVSSLADMAELAHENEPYVRTYVIGLGGDTNLDQIARGGGTHDAFTVDDGDISGSFSKALRNVANTKLACEYALPPPPNGSQKLDLSRLSVTYTSAGDEITEEIPSISGISACANAPNGGWYYDNPADPTSIQVCPCTCTRFDAGRVDVRVGCKPVVGPR